MALGLNCNQLKESSLKTVMRAEISVEEETFDGFLAAYIGDRSRLRGLQDARQFCLGFRTGARRNTPGTPIMTRRAWSCALRQGLQDTRQLCLGFRTGARRSTPSMLIMTRRAWSCALRRGEGCKTLVSFRHKAQAARGLLVSSTEQGPSSANLSMDRTSAVSFVAPSSKLDCHGSSSECKHQREHHCGRTPIRCR